MREHLKKYFMAMAEHHVSMAKAHQSMVSDDDEDSDACQFHKGAMASHTTAAESCTECAKACDTSRKADEKDFDKLMPSQISAVAPTPPHIRMVPRAGQQQLPPASENPMVKEIFGTQEFEQ